MIFKELLQEAKDELEEERKTDAKEQIKEHLKEIEEAKIILSKLKKKFEDLLDGSI